MSLENNLKRIADALEKIAENGGTLSVVDNLTALNVPTTATAPVAEAPAAPVAEVPAAPVAEVPAAPVAEVPAAPVALSDIDMNNQLVVEFKRLGSRDAIDNAMKELGITSVQGLTAEVQQQLLTNVRAIEAVVS